MNDSPSPRTVMTEVVHVENVTKRWRRIVIDTKDAYSRLKPYYDRVIDDGIAGAYHQHFLFPVGGADAERFPRLSGPFVDQFFNVDASLYGDPDVKFVSRRSYTVRPVDGDVRHVELNFALHGDGLAMNWARRAEPGMQLIMDLGGRGVDIDEFPIVGTYLLMGDETSVPSIATMLPRLPSAAAVSVCIEVTDADDQWVFETQGHETIDWIPRGDQEAGTSEFLIECCKNFAWPTDGDVYVWVASEGGQVRALRSHLRSEVGLVRGQYDLMGYWRRGVRTEQMLEAEATTVNTRVAAGLTPFHRPVDDDQKRKTAYETLHVEDAAPRHDEPLNDPNH